MINIILKDGASFEIDEPMTIFDVAKKININLVKKACCALVDGELKDLRFVIEKNCQLEILSFDNEFGLGTLRHSCAHVLAQAVKRLFPEIKLAIGPNIKDGFYYDFDGKILLDDLAKVENEMKKIIKENYEIKRFELGKNEALKLMTEKNEPYKVELINNLPVGAEISFYEQGEFVDLCAGPHILKTGDIKAFKLISIAGAYWHGNEKNKMLTRIYGTAFEKKSSLDDYLNKLEEAKKRDHRKLGRELELFELFDEAPGMPFFLPNGMILKNNLIEYWRAVHKKNSYDEISTPMILNKNLWIKSGHWAHYKENMYTTVIDEQDFAVKPMNCPGSILVYKNKLRSYKDLPLRFAELGLVHRHEKSGTLHGLMRVRCFTQDDAHIFITQEQIKSEIKNIIDLIDKFYLLFGFKYYIELSTRPDDSMGSDEDWEKATEALKNALTEKNLDFKINEGDGAFYGPKIDFHLEDSLGRTWQCGTIQLDFQLPEKFELEYIGADNQKHRPIMIHRVVFGSIERFIGILIEHYGGNFPIWIAPVQVKILPISDKFNDYAQKICDELKLNNIRCEIDLRAEKINYKIREAKLKKIKYLVVIGEKEMNENNISVRLTSGKNIFIGLDEFIKKINDEVKSKKDMDFDL